MMPGSYHIDNVGESFLVRFSCKRKTIMVRKNFKKATAVVLLSASLVGVGTGAAHAVTVKYKGTPVSWDYGTYKHNNDKHSYSKVFSTVYEHHATANSAHSGWKKPDHLASADHKLRKGEKATAFWNCRG